MLLALRLELDFVGCGGGEGRLCGAFQAELQHRPSREGE